jgi:hypothetical protein
MEVTAKQHLKTTLPRFIVCLKRSHWLSNGFICASGVRQFHTHSAQEHTHTHTHFNTNPSIFPYMCMRKEKRVVMAPSYKAKRRYILFLEFLFYFRALDHGDSLNVKGKLNKKFLYLLFPLSRYCLLKQTTFFFIILLILLFYTPTATRPVCWRPLLYVTSWVPKIWLKFYRSARPFRILCRAH